jgi:D-alanyl-D-alanine carboxypeptidase (penicillin-binding protein 5/6)
VADAVTVAPVTEIGWARAAAGAPTPAVDTVPIATARKGAAVGTASLSPQLSTALVLDRALTDPGPLWRLGHPGVVIPQFVRWVSGG